MVKRKEVTDNGLHMHAQNNKILTKTTQQQNRDFNNKLIPYHNEESNRIRAAYRRVRNLNQLD